MKKVLVIGDSCEDVFRYGSCNRLCPEAPAPIINPTRTVISGGMALNVYENLKALGIECDIITNEMRPTKIRYVDEISNQLLLRVDNDDDIKEITDEEFNLIDFSKYDAIVISDYDKGFISEEIIKKIGTMHDLVFMDSKKEMSSWANYVDIIKINESEFKNNSEWLVKYYEGELVVTKGMKGAQHWFYEYPIESKELHQVMDLSGAGDTFLAALVAEYIKNSDICKAIEFANKCASWVVTQKGVVAVNLNKI